MAVAFDDDEDFLIYRIIGDIEDAEENDVRPVREFHERINAFDASERSFLKNFRFSKNMARQLIDVLTPFLNPPSRRSAIDIETKVLVALFFYGHGCYQEGAGKHLYTALSQPSVSRCLHEVTNALNNDQVKDNYLKFPHSLNELRDLRQRFYEKYNFPGVIGCIDGTHIAIVRPDEDEHTYVNRKNYHSLNVQVICDEELRLISVNSRFPGSCHDAHVWRQSNISQVMETIHERYNDESFYFLGDSGYPLRPWLLTALQNPLPDTPEERFSNHLRSVRSSIERCIGVWKNRFRCLLKYRTLHYQPEKAAKIVIACAVLHNICINNNVPETERDEVVQLELQNENIAIEDNNLVVGGNPQLAEARRLQARIIATRYN